MNFIPSNKNRMSLISSEEMEAAKALESLSEESINSKRNSKICEVQAFVNFLLQNLNKESCEIQRIELFSIKNSMITDVNPYKWQCKIFNVLSSVQQKDLHHLKKISQEKGYSQFLKQIPDLAKIKMINQIANVFEKILPVEDLELENADTMILFHLFTRLGNKTGQKEEIEKLIYNSQIKNAFLKFVSKKLIETGNLNEARKIAAMISDLIIRTGIFSEISTLREDQRSKEPPILEPIDYSYGPLILKKKDRRKMSYVSSERI